MDAQFVPFLTSKMERMVLQTGRLASGRSARGMDGYKMSGWKPDLQ